MDIGAAQDLLGRVGQLTRIDPQLQPGTDRAPEASAASPARLAPHNHAGRAGRCGPSG